MSDQDERYKYKNQKTCKGYCSHGRRLHLKKISKTKHKQSRETEIDGNGMAKYNPMNKPSFLQSPSRADHKLIQEDDEMVRLTHTCSIQTQPYKTVLNKRPGRMSKNLDRLCYYYNTHHHFTKYIITWSIVANAKGAEKAAAW